MNNRYATHIIVSIVLSVWVLPVWGQVEEAAKLFDEGNRLYRDGQYEAAIRVYEDARAKGFTNGELNYNLGNAYYRNDELGQAIRYYEKARVFMPDNEELLHNISIAKSKTRDQFSSLPVPAWVEWWRSYVARNGGRMFFIVGLLVYILAIALVIHRIRTGTKNPWFRRARSFSLVISLVLLATAFAASLQTEQMGKAVIISERIELRSSPSESGELLLPLHEGIVVEMLQQQEGWVEIRLPNGTLGWVPSSDLADV